MIDTSNVVVLMSVWRMISGSGRFVVIRGDNELRCDRGSYYCEHSGWRKRSSRNPQVSIPKSTRQPINHWRRCYRYYEVMLRLYVGNRVLVGMGSIVLDGAMMKMTRNDWRGSWCHSTNGWKVAVYILTVR